MPAPGGRSEAPAVREDLGCLRVTAAAASPAGHQYDEHDRGRKRQRAAHPVADELLALLSGSRLAFALQALATERLLLFPAVRHGGEG